MRVSARLAEWFHPGGQDREDRNFEAGLVAFLVGEGLLESAEELASDRFLRRSVAPHVERLSQHFNRIEAPGLGVEKYWGSGSNPDNLRMAYVLAFMPPNAMRVASVWEELLRYGWKPQATGRLKLTEWGAGPGAGAYGLVLAEALSAEVQNRAARDFDVRLVEQDRKTLELGTRWLQTATNAAVSGIHGKIDLAQGLTESLPPATRSRYDVFLSSFFLNEFHASPEQIARALLAEWERWMEPGGVAILVEPALKAQSRRLLEIRAELLKLCAADRRLGYSVLLPCLGSQACGALANPDDWCHEEVTWWRPDVLVRLDRMTGLNRKTLPFSYLVIQKANADIRQALPALPTPPDPRLALHRLVSPAHGVGPKRAGRFDYFVCGPEGKFKTHARHEKDTPPERGDILGLLRP